MTYSNGNIVEMSIISALAKGGCKVKLQPMNQSVKELKKVLIKHAPKHWYMALPHLEREGMFADNVWDFALHTDLVANYRGWLIAVDVVIDPAKVDDKLGNHLQVKDCLLQLGIDKSLILLLNEADDAPNWRAKLETIMSEVIKTKNFAHTAEMDY